MPDLALGNDAMEDWLTPPSGCTSGRDEESAPRAGVLADDLLALLMATYYLVSKQC